MACSTISPLGALTRGLLAGVVGTAAMDLYWFYWYKRGAGESGLLEWEFSVGLTAWDDAAAPAQVGKRLYEGLFQRSLPATRAALMNNLMHWAYGLSWSALYGLAGASTRPPRVLSGVVLGSVVWTSGYVILPLAGLYKPMWEYDGATLAKDLGAHLIYGVGTATAFWISAPDRGT
jgi:hypothetical protein